MPELPEVETIVRDLRALTVGREISGVKVGLPKMVHPGPRRLARFLIGTRISAVERQGKFIVFTLDRDKHLVVHLRMTGHFLWRQPPPPTPLPKHVHVILNLGPDAVLWYEDQRQFGTWFALTAEEYERWKGEGHVGPDPFEMTAEDFGRLLAGRKTRIKALLLDQRRIGGLGNIYADESLFAAGVHPKTPAGSISTGQAARLFGEIRRILSAAIELRGSTTDNYVGLSGVGGQYQHSHHVYGRDGEPCPSCGQALQREIVAGRSTHFCPCCQPEN